MTDDLPLFNQPERAPEWMSFPTSRIEREFARFHRENPNVFARLEQLARRWQERRPGRRMGIKMLYEVARYEITLQTTGDEFKLNNNFHSLYARLLLWHHPEWTDLVELRRRREPGCVAA